MNAVLFLTLIALLVCMSYLMKRIPEWVFEHVANRSSFRSEFSRIAFEHQVTNAARAIGNAELAELLKEMAENTVPILSKQERHLRSAISRTIQKGSYSLADDTVIKKLNDALLETEEAILEHREFGKHLLRSVLSAKSNPKEAHALHIKLFALKEQLESARARYQSTIGATHATMQPQPEMSVAQNQHPA